MNVDSGICGSGCGGRHVWETERVTSGWSVQHKALQQLADQIIYWFCG